MQLRSLVYLQIERVNVADNGRDIVYDAHLDWRSPRRSPEFPAQLGACCAIECLVHVFVEARVLDVEFGHRQTGDASKSVLQETSQRIAVLGRKLLEYDKRHLQLARMC